MSLIPTFLRDRPFIPITTQRLTLRLCVEKDAEAFVDIFKDEDVRRFLSSVPSPYHLQNGLEKVQQAFQAYQEGKALFLVIELRETGQVIGIIELKETEELGYALRKPFWGKGYGKEAVFALLQFAFSLLSIQEVKALADPQNALSQNLLTTLGFEVREDVCNSPEDKRLFSLSKKAFEKKIHLPALSQAPIFAAALILMRSDGSFLVAQIPEHKSFPGTWELPGGKLHPGETPETALIREIDEELGIHVNLFGLKPLTFASHRVLDKHIIVFFYLCHQWLGEPYGKEQQKIAWIKAHELLEYPPPAPDLAAFHTLADLVAFF